MDVELRIQENMYLQCFCDCEKYDGRMTPTLHDRKTRLALLRIRMKRPRLYQMKIGGSLRSQQSRPLFTVSCAAWITVRAWREVI